MTYLLLKALHIISVMLWFGGLLVLSLLITALNQKATSDVERYAPFIAFVRRWDTIVTTPPVTLWT
ncbi:MAG: hypothetical protein AAF512_22355, partial [Pseudomonadota bacterium]